MSLAKLNKKGLRYTALCTTVSMLAVNAAFGESIGPSGESVQTGSATVDRSVADKTTINQNSNYVKFHWQSFDTSSDHTVHFVQPSATSVALNRVIGGVPTNFAGKLDANGVIIIQNDRGITFTETSQINVGSLIATTASDLNDELSEDGNLVKLSANGSLADGDIAAQGNIKVSDRGFAILVAPYVSTTGTLNGIPGIQANLGRVEIASATKYTIDLQGDNLITYELSNESLEGINRTNIGVDNNADIEAHSGHVNISTHTVHVEADAASEIVQSVINLSGVVDANAFITQDNENGNGGSISISGVGNINSSFGTLTASGSGSGNGGTINIETHSPDANTSPATVVTLTTASTLIADSGSTEGNGGTIRIDGDLVSLGAAISAQSASGEKGTLNVRSSNLSIENGGIDDFIQTNEPLPADVIFEQYLEKLSGDNIDINLESNNAIAIKAIEDTNINGTKGSISLRANGDITAENNTRISTTTGDISIHSTGGAINLANNQLTSASGDILLLAKNAVATKDITSDTGLIGIKSETAAITTGNLLAGRDILLNSDATIVGTEGEASITSTNGAIFALNITSDDNLTITAGSTINTGALTSKDGALNVTSTSSTINSGNLNAKGDISLGSLAFIFNNNGEASAISSTGKISTQSVISNSNLTLHAKNGISTGKGSILSVEGSVNITSDTAGIETNSILASSGITLTAANLIKANRVDSTTGPIAIEVVRGGDITVGDVVTGINLTNANLDPAPFAAFFNNPTKNGLLEVAPLINQSHTNGNKIFISNNSNGAELGDDFTSIGNVTVGSVLNAGKGPTSIDIQSAGQLFVKSVASASYDVDANNPVNADSSIELSSGTGGITITNGIFHTVLSSNGDAQATTEINVGTRNPAEEVALNINGSLPSDIVARTRVFGLENASAEFIATSTGNILGNGQIINEIYSLDPDLRSNATSLINIAAEKDFNFTGNIVSGTNVVNGISDATAQLTYSTGTFTAITPDATVLSAVANTQSLNQRRIPSTFGTVVNARFDSAANNGGGNGGGGNGGGNGGGDGGTGGDGDSGTGNPLVDIINGVSIPTSVQVSFLVTEGNNLSAQSLAGLSPAAGGSDYVTNDEVCKKMNCGINEQ